MNRLNLKKCPICCEKPAIEISWNKPKIHGQYAYKAVCIHCNNETATFANYKDAVGAWNMRLCTNTHQLNLFNYMENAHE